ncbi:hypothetical protein [Streptomyces candidus]|uniref:Uncharacterized protein n=1 Tax=Streptomyces candidus TaxID=67283 RepID=A0A7X0LQW2_9ACTN|nr:hypothetical protein [Streptomyces candidus]MBB6436859.1 hypothetical protein [Streptomyces candidus]GHH32043.1 hypothetical protein GCM10018773_00400 [Streptomyces candidus]
MNNTQKGAQTGQTRQIRQIRDTDDRTMQLDSVGPQFGKGPGNAPVMPELPAEGGDGPVFVDESGRRGKKFRRLGWVLGAVCACYAAMLVASLIGGSSIAPGLFLPGVPTAEEKADKVKSEPTPDPSVPKPDSIPPVSGDQQPDPGGALVPGTNDKVPAGDAEKPDPKDSPAGTKPPTVPGKAAGGAVAAGGAGAAAAGGAAAGGAAAGGAPGGGAGTPGGTPGGGTPGGGTPGGAGAGDAGTPGGAGDADAGTPGGAGDADAGTPGGAGDAGTPGGAADSGAADGGETPIDPPIPPVQ